MSGLFSGEFRWVVAEGFGDGEFAGVLGGPIAEEVDRQSQDEDAEDEQFGDDNDGFGAAERSESGAEQRGHGGRKWEVREGLDDGGVRGAQDEAYRVERDEDQGHERSERDPASLAVGMTAPIATRTAVNRPAQNEPLVLV